MADPIFIVAPPDSGGAFLVNALAAALRAELAAELRLLDAPRNLQRVPVLHAVFPAAKFVYLYREPPPAAEEFERLPLGSWIAVADHELTERPAAAVARV